MLKIRVAVLLKLLNKTNCSEKKEVIKTVYSPPKEKEVIKNS